MMYGKIYESTFTGSMVGTGAHVFAVWGYVIANTKPDSMVELNPVLIGAMVGEDAQRIESAIDILCAVDPKSRTKKHQGRRLIKRGEFLYFVPNYQKYRGLPNDTERKAYFALKQREHRQRVTKPCQTVMSKPVKQAVSSKQKHKEEAEEEIYQAFPRKVGKPSALQSIRRALKKFPFDKLLAATKAFAMVRNGDLEFCPNPSTWFNQERFNDDPSTWVRTNGQFAKSLTFPERRKRSEQIQIALNDQFKSATKDGNGRAIFTEPERIKREKLYSEMQSLT